MMNSAPFDADETEDVEVLRTWIRAQQRAFEAQRQEKIAIARLVEQQKERIGQLTRKIHRQRAELRRFHALMRKAHKLIVLAKTLGANPQIKL